jgi:hypothetical protein
MIAAEYITGLRELSRRRTALAFILLLPMAFYFVRIDVHWRAIRFLSIGVGWAIATLSLFSHAASRHMDRRLAAIGGSPTGMFLGRQLAVLSIGVAIAVAYFGVVAATQRNLPRLGGVLVLLLMAVFIAVPLGALVAMLITRELEGALALLFVMALQLLVDPAKGYAKLLPMWSTREITTWATQDQPGDALRNGLTHFLVYLAALAVITWLATIIRLKPVRLPNPELNPAAGSAPVR